MNETTLRKKHKFIYNFFLTPEEKELIFTLKHLHRLNNNIGNDSESYSEFIEKMSCYYKQILAEYKN
jgi:hypothetical protein